MNPLNILLLLDTITAGLARLGEIGSLIQKARDEGRDVTDAELDDLRAKDDAAKATLDALIAAKRAGG